MVAPESHDPRTADRPRSAYSLQSAKLPPVAKVVNSTDAFRVAEHHPLDVATHQVVSSDSSVAGAFANVSVGARSVDPDRRLRFDPRVTQAPSILDYGPGRVRPGVIAGYKAYCIVMALIYLIAAIFCLGIGIWMMSDHSGASNRLEGAFLAFTALVCLPLMAAFLLPFFFSVRPWLWVYGIVLIAIGTTSVCTLPFCVWMLILWIREDCRAWFGWGSKG